MTGNSLALRKIRDEDAAAVLVAFSADPAMIRQGRVTDIDEAQRYIRTYTQIGAEHHGVAVVDALDTLVGMVGLDVYPADRRAWLYYWMNVSHRGRGWASLAVRSVADWALTDGGLERLELGHRADNLASGAIARRAGFILEGIERGKFFSEGQRVDVLTYGRLVSDPWPMRSPLPILQM
ncbi:GNAT family N-acetyltransferase [Austwickia sp. TVS 96-490-7B]|uniref:GNAT family N-acetyltransferase n=1 Tax=Austwickia sp. TVS 96-490-7B TaxID=2830843 RepID=UPI001C58E959|nr:GNAT family N-acetyltransferase [Austwickia sp. TVS 96-490-7B]